MRTPVHDGRILTGLARATRLIIAILFDFAGSVVSTGAGDRCDRDSADTEVDATERGEPERGQVSQANFTVVLWDECRRGCRDRAWRRDSDGC